MIALLEFPSAKAVKDFASDPKYALSLSPSARQ